MISFTVVLSLVALVVEYHYFRWSTSLKKYNPLDVPFFFMGSRAARFICWLIPLLIYFFSLFVFNVHWLYVALPYAIVGFMGTRKAKRLEIDALANHLVKTKGMDPQTAYSEAKSMVQTLKGMKWRAL